MNWSKIGTPKNVLCLPGTKSPERELAEYLLDEVRDVDAFWASVNNDYSRYVCFKDCTIEEIQSDRKKAKAWFQSQLPLWGKTRNKAISLWAKTHRDEVNVFQDELKNAYNAFAETYELDPIE